MLAQDGGGGEGGKRRTFVGSLTVRVRIVIYWGAGLNRETTPGQASIQC